MSRITAQRLRWIILTIVCLAALLQAAFGFAWTGYVLSWGGAIFKALTGGAIGYAVSRFVVGLDLSTIHEDKRPTAGLAQALLIGLFAVAVASGI